MDDVSTVTEMIKRLPSGHRRRLIDLIWLLSRVDSQRRSAAIKRLEPLLDGESHDEASFVARLEEAIDELRQTVDRDAKKRR